MTTGPLAASSRVLNDRYRLVRRMSRDADLHQGCETWIARDEDETPFLLKAWPTGGEPNLVLRAIWDRELRVLYRASSSAGADASLLVVREAQFDRQSAAFLLLCEGPGYDTLATALQARSDYSWLKSSALKQRDARSLLWKGLRCIATGIRALHAQQIMHRGVAPESVYMDLEDGPETMRLGAFEWSVRVGATSENPPAESWSTPPEVLDGRGGFTFDADWYGLGMLIARCMVVAEGWRDMPAEARRSQVHREVGSTPSLTGRERDFIRRLIEGDPRSRLTYAEEILRLFDEVIASLKLPAGSQESRPLHLVVAASNTKLVDALCALGFDPDPSRDEVVPYSPRDPLHVANLREFIRTDVTGGLVYGMSQPDRCVLRGKQISLLLRPYQDDYDGTATWDFAHVSHAVGLFADENNFRPIPLGSIAVSVLTPREVANARGRGVRSWEPLIPRVDEVSPLARTLSQFQDFLRCTNQLDLLMRDGEIAAYELVGRLPTTAGREVIEIRERGRPRPVADFCMIAGGMTELLQRELDSRKQFCERVFLTEGDALLVRADVAKDWWEIDGDIDSETGIVRLCREIVPGQAPLPEKGFIRTYGQYAAVTLIRRRTDAIDRLQEHSYLLRALAQPGQVFMDTQVSELPRKLDPETVDESKMAVIQDVLRVRPMYALQGPPGTGKTTLVAHLLRQILTEDPVAQILVTAPGHGAVDVLRGKVRDDVFAGAQESDKPLSVRLGRRGGSSWQEEGSVSQVTFDLLTRVKVQLEEMSEPTRVQQQWLELVRRMTSAANTSVTPGTDLVVDQARRDLGDTEELVKRSASITYCTTSAFDLEELADGNHSFDWSIVEEAGKSHGFDLALPLQAGHRWLLLGDQFQLPPYRIKDYARGLSQLGNVVEALATLPSQQLVDRDWTSRWGRYSEPERADFQKFCQGWLPTFGTLFNQLREAIFGAERMTVANSVGAATGRLSVQYRMHPAIGTLISKAFYPEFGGIRNATLEDGKPVQRILHAIDKPIDLRGKAIVWIDTPWCVQDERAREMESPRYTNTAEAEAVRAFLGGLHTAGVDLGEVAVLSPYTAQVRLLRKFLKSLGGAGGLRFRQSIQRTEASEAHFQAAHTVDSFQGNEADVVVVSFARNNTKQPGSGLGFLADDPSRFNVMLSRAEKLLVLVGSWDFMTSQVAHVPPANREHELWALRTAMDELSDAIARGDATRISASELISKMEGQ